MSSKLAGSSRARRLWIAVTVLALAFGSARGRPAHAGPQEPEPAATASSSAEPAPGFDPRGGDARVVGTAAVDLATGDRTQPRRYYLDDVLAIEVRNLEGWLRRHDQGVCDVQLYLNGRPLLELEPMRCDLDGDELLFNLWLIDRSREPAWKALVAIRDGFDAHASVSVGLKGDLPLPTDFVGRKVLRFQVVHEYLALGSLTLYALALVCFLVLVGTTNILRESPAVPLRSGRAPFSLGRVQMAWWTFLVLGGYLLISLITGALAQIPSSILGLMGIAAGTFLGSEAIEVSGSGGRSASGPASSQGFLTDVLSDANGLALHRFQILIWTVVFGLVYVYAVWSRLAMPDFGTSALGLMGLSSGTYLGFKIPEQAKAAAGRAPASPAPEPAAEPTVDVTVDE